MAVSGQQTGATFGNAQGVVFDGNGVAIPPRRPYTLLEQWERSFVEGWASLDEMNVSLQTAPPSLGLPDGAPNPNAVYLEGGMLCRYVVDPDVKRESFVHRDDDGHEEVRERIQFRKQYVALTLTGAKLATDKRDAEKGEPETDFWCGYCWIRGGYSPERVAPTEVKRAMTQGPVLVFDQAASPTDAARLRHEVATMDRHNVPLPIEATKPRRGRPPKVATLPPEETAGATGPAEE